MAVGFWTLEATTSRLMNEMMAVFDDTRLNKRLVQDKILVARAAVLSDFLMQWRGNLPPQYINECCVDIICEPVCPGSPILRTRAKLPSVPGKIGFRAYRYVGTVDGKISFRYSETAEEVNDYVTVGTKPKSPYYTLVGRTADLYNLPVEGMKKLYVKGMFSDPFACECPEDQIFVAEDHIDRIEQYIKKDLATFLIQRKIDKLNNAQTDN